MAALVEIVPYDPDWPRHFSDIEYKLRQILGARVVAIDHIGSTSIPGMPAKPLVDIDVTLKSISEVPAASAALIESGYDARGNRYDDDVWAFMLHNAEPKQRVYLCPPDNETHKDRLIFRDYLRRHADTADAYSLLKKKLAREFSYDGDRYTAEKSGFIDQIIKRARAT